MDILHYQTPKWSKLGSYLHDTNIWVIFLSPQGDPIYGYSYCSVNNFVELPSYFGLNVLLKLSKGPNSGGFCIITVFGVIFGKKWVFDPRGDHI